MPASPTPVTSALISLAAEALGWGVRRGLERGLGLKVTIPLQDGTKRIIHSWLQKQADIYAASASLSHSSPPSLSRPALGAAPGQARGISTNSSCPTCQLYHNLAEAHALLDDIAMRQLSDDSPLPPGLGGTMPLVKGQVQTSLVLCNQLVTQEGGLLGALAGHLSLRLDGLPGQLEWVDNISQVRAMVPILLQCRKIAHRIAQIAFTGGCESCSRQAKQIQKV